jgi:nucleoside-triphosphatase
MKKNIFLTGSPSSGKTTVIKKIIGKIEYPANGFYTEEEKKDNKRIGFFMKTLDGKQGYLAHQDIPSPYRIRRYGVSIDNIENIAVPSIKPQKDAIIILDEIGKMECFSDLFKTAVVEALDAVNIVIGTIAFGGDEFIQAVKQRDDIEITEVLLDNREDLPDLIVERISVIYSRLQ